MSVKYGWSLEFPVYWAFSVCDINKQRKNVYIPVFIWNPHSFSRVNSKIVQTILYHTWRHGGNSSTISPVFEPIKEDEVCLENGLYLCC